MHLIIEHSAILTCRQGPLGFWSQQSYEGSHKIVKTNISRSSSFGGGKTGDRKTTSVYQVMAKHARMFILKIRRAVSQALIDDSNATAKAPDNQAHAWMKHIGSVFCDRKEEVELLGRSRVRNASRIRRLLPSLLVLGNSIANSPSPIPSQLISIRRTPANTTEDESSPPPLQTSSNVCTPSPSGLSFMELLSTPLQGISATAGKEVPQMAYLTPQRKQTQLYKQAGGSLRSASPLTPGAIVPVYNKTF